MVIIEWFACDLNRIIALHVHCSINSEQTNQPLSKVPYFDSFVCLTLFVCMLPHGYLLGYEITRILVLQTWKPHNALMKDHLTLHLCRFAIGFCFVLKTLNITHSL